MKAALSVNDDRHKSLLHTGLLAKSASAGLDRGFFAAGSVLVDVFLPDGSGDTPGDYPCECVADGETGEQAREAAQITTEQSKWEGDQQ